MGRWVGRPPLARAPNPPPQIPQRCVCNGLLKFVHEGVQHASFGLRRDPPPYTRRSAFWCRSRCAGQAPSHPNESIGLHLGPAAGAPPAPQRAAAGAGPAAAPWAVDAEPCEARAAPTAAIGAAEAQALSQVLLAEAEGRLVLEPAGPGLGHGQGARGCCAEGLFGLVHVQESGGTCAGTGRMGTGRGRGADQGCAECTANGTGWGAALEILGWGGPPKYPLPPPPPLWWTVWGVGGNNFPPAGGGCPCMQSPPAAPPPSDSER